MNFIDKMTVQCYTEHSSLWEGKSINTVITSREAILAKCVEMAGEKGAASINIRAVANACHVSVGSIYYYFPSKADLVCAMIEEIWNDILRTGDQAMPLHSFPDCVAWIFANGKAGLKKYPNFFFAHSMSFAGDEKERGRRVMEQCFSHIRAGLSEALQKDEKVNPGAFSGEFTRSDFVEFVFTSLLTLFAKEEDSCAVLNEVVRRVLYG
ncbi:MAG: TetR/AcrR family transcriptional regulator [Candidatus Heritagella sp.]